MRSAGRGFSKKLHIEDKAALRSYLTGQIRNILANEYGIGGRASVEGELKIAARQRVDHVLNDADFLASTIERILKTRSYNLISIIEKVAAQEAKAALKERFSEAAEHITFTVSVEQKQKDAPENFGKF